MTPLFLSSVPPRRCILRPQKRLMFQGSVGRRPKPRRDSRRSVTACRTKGAFAPRTRVEQAMRLALFEPDIPQNLGSFVRLAACLGTALDIIEPCGFPVDDKRIRRAAMDYYDLARIRRHASWRAFQESRGPGRLILLTTRATETFPTLAFPADDTLLLGRESAGVPDDVHAAA